LNDFYRAMLLRVWLWDCMSSVCLSDCPSVTFRYRDHIEYGWGQEHIKAVKSPKRCQIGPRLLLRTNRKSHTRFRLVPTSMTLDDLERLKCHSCRNKISYGAHHEDFNEDRSTSLAEKCRPMILVSKNISICGYARRFHRGEASCRILPPYTCNPASRLYYLLYNASD